MSTLAVLEFDAFDNPMQLSKVGNWVFTFLNQPERVEDTQLGLTYVLPRQAEHALQIRRLILQHGENSQLWHILEVECFDGQNHQELQLSPLDPRVTGLIQQTLHEFSRYDVMVKIKLIEA